MSGSKTFTINSSMLVWSAVVLFDAYVELYSSMITSDVRVRVQVLQVDNVRFIIRVRVLRIIPLPFNRPNGISGSSVGP